MSKVIGILALQGDFEAHRKAFGAVGAQTVEVRTPQQLEGVDALVLPGGESTTVIKLMRWNGLDEAIRARAEKGMPLFGTCAGLILLSSGVEGMPEQPTLGLLNVEVARNAFGRQIDSFEADIPVRLGDENSHEETVRGVFIRAPKVVEAAPGVEVISRFRDAVVGVRQGSRLGIAFHPELTDDTRLHAYFAEMVAASAEER